MQEELTHTDSTTLKATPSGECTCMCADDNIGYIWEECCILPQQLPKHSCQVLSCLGRASMVMQCRRLVKTAKHSYVIQVVRTHNILQRCLHAEDQVLPYLSVNCTQSDYIPPCEHMLVVN